MTGWLVDWPASAVLNTVYALMTDGMNAEERAEFDEELLAPLTEAGRSVEAAVERAVMEVIGGDPTR